MALRVVDASYFSWHKKTRVGASCGQERRAGDYLDGQALCQKETATKGHVRNQ